MGSIFFESHNRPKPSQRALRIISMFLIFLVIATSAVSAGGTSLQAEAGDGLQELAQNRDTSVEPHSPVRNAASSGHMSLNGVGQLHKAVGTCGSETAGQRARRRCRPVAAAHPVPAGVSAQAAGR